jgi:uncharacterized protein YbaA (DUF1428 family)
MAYVDGFVVPVPKDKRDAYLKVAQTMAGLFRECGAIKVMECWGDDVPEGKVTSFPMAVKREPNENVVFSWVVWPSKEARDAGNAKLMADPRMQPGGMDMPFDGKRMIMGGFEVLLDA